MKYFKILSDWYFSKKALPHWAVLLVDCFIVLFAALLGKYFELDTMNFGESFLSIIIGALIGMSLYAFSFLVFRTYKGILRYSSFVDLQRIALSTLSGALLTLVAWFATSSTTAISVVGPQGILVTFIVSTLLMWTERVMVKRLFDNFRTDDAIPVVIYGTKAGGISLAKSIFAV